ncbi:hypothetical protein VNI00_014614 [Paramarasmius palmivorus]|uniref:Uncharacterized protein n=1 Tax=Paramarasmius palmivorus TaxID=297713 RepID=A0AAW0BQF2_9AGAR
MVRKFWLYAPLIHSEELKDHDLVKTKIEEMRRDVEAYSGRRDPARDTWEEDAKDVTLFARLVKEEPPKTFADFFFWLFRVFDAHRPIIERYGRYPYRNVAQGRETSEAEEHYLQLTENFGMPELSEEEVQKLKRQVKEDVWDPLSDSGPA